MSNIIKSGFVCINSVDTRLIYSNEENKNQETKKAPETKTVVTMDLSQALKEKEKMLRDEEANLKVRYQQVMDDAEAKAEQIIKEAQEKAELIKETALAEGKEEGLQLGLSKGQEELEELKTKLNSERTELESKYNNMISKFESDFVENFINVFEKISGIMIDDKKDVILHLINQQIGEVEKSNHYVIRVSKDDYELVNNKKQLLYDYVGQDATIEIIETDTLSRNKCLIETDNSVIDCSIDTQIKNLISDLRMLSKK